MSRRLDDLPIAAYRITTPAGVTFTVRCTAQEAAAHIAAGRVVAVVS